MEIINNDEPPLLSSLQPDGWPDIVPHFDYYTKSPFCFPVKMIVDKEIVGIGAAIIHSDVAWLGHIIVHPDHRRKGIGQLITRTLVDTAWKNSCSTIYLIATELGKPVYLKVGFQPETEYIVYKCTGEKKDFLISGNIQNYNEMYREHFAAFDKTVSGEDRMNQLEEHLTNALMYCNNGVIEGYYLPTLGEGLIIADTGHAGIELLKLKLKHCDKIVVPKENSIARTFLRDIEFEEYKSIKRMRLGKVRPVKFSNIYNRIGGSIG